MDSENGDPDVIREPLDADYQFNTEHHHVGAADHDPCPIDNRVGPNFGRPICRRELSQLEFQVKQIQARFDESPTADAYRAVCDANELKRRKLACFTDFASRIQEFGDQLERKGLVDEATAIDSLLEELGTALSGR